MRKKKFRIDFDGDRDFGTLCICAIRYCHGRETYMPSLVRDIIRPHLSELTDADLTVMIEDCAFQARCDLYGDEKIDKPGWLAWEMELRAERKRREEERDKRLGKVSSLGECQTELPDVRIHHQDINEIVSD